MRLGSTRVTVSLGSSFFRVRAAVAPPNPPPITTTRPAPCAAAPARARPRAPAASFRGRRRVGRALLRLRGEPGREGVDLLIVETLGDAAHDGRRPGAALEFAHGRGDVGRLASGDA